MIIKSKKGEGEIQTLMYLFFAVIFIIAGLISVKAYLINVDINKDLQLSNLDFGVIGNRMMASDNCLAEQNTVEIFDGDETYSVSFTQIGTIERSKINPTTIERCLEGFDKIEACSDPQYTTESDCLNSNIALLMPGAALLRVSAAPTIINFWEEITIEKYGASFYDIDENNIDDDGNYKRTQIAQSYGTLNCKPVKRKGEFLINIKETSGQTNLGVFKLCVI